MASGVKIISLVLFSFVFTGCYAPDLVEVSTKLSTQCGLSPSGPSCVSVEDTAVVERLWERFILAEVTSAEVESCVLAMECSSDANSAENEATVVQALDDCVNQYAQPKNPACMWQCLSNFFECSPALGQSCDVDFVDGCIDAREACEHHC